MITKYKSFSIWKMCLQFFSSFLFKKFGFIPKTHVIISLSSLIHLYAVLLYLLHYSITNLGVRNKDSRCKNIGISFLSLN